MIIPIQMGLLTLALTLVACGKDSAESPPTEGNPPAATGGVSPSGGSVSAAGAECEGQLISADQRYLQGAVAVALPGRENAAFTLHVQRLEKTGGSTWTTTPVETFKGTGETPCEAFHAIAAMWQQFFADLVSHDLEPAVIGMYLDGIGDPRGEAERKGAGVYAESDIGTCGYAGKPGAIYCGLGHDESFRKYYVAHEATHGFQWERGIASLDEEMTLYRVFGVYANDFYRQGLSDPAAFQPADGKWRVDPADYALQNEVEWQAELFRGYIYSGPDQWAYIASNFPKLRAFFDCIWLTGDSNQTCQRASGFAVLDFAEKLPSPSTPEVSGFSAAESEAIWNVCLQQANTQQVEVFGQMIERLTPGRYGNSAPAFKLGYGDCNHDGFIDWVCSYHGRAPDGSSYLWNTANRVGTYSFIASGRNGDDYAEYLQDPFLERESDGGTLLQPIYSQWKGRFGSCNGADYLHWAPEYFPIVASGIGDLPEALRTKTVW